MRATSAGILCSAPSWGIIRVGRSISGVKNTAGKLGQHEQSRLAGGAFADELSVSAAASALSIQTLSGPTATSIPAPQRGIYTRVRELDQN